MKFNKWTMGLAAIGVVSLASAARADEKSSALNTALSNTTISGYVDVAAQWNLGAQNGGATPAFAFNGGKADGFNFNAVDIALDRPMDESPWAAGYHVELMFGPDATPGAAATGRRGAVSNTTSANIRQAYLALRTPLGNSGIDWKVGVWDTIIGYESTSDPSNPNYTRSYGYTIEPTTHTGILATYKFNDILSVSAGIADGSQLAAVGYTVGPTPINGRNVQESKKAYMGSISLTAPDSAGFLKGATMNVGIINNDDGPRQYGSFANYGSTSFYAGITVPTPLNALKVGAAFDYADVHNGQNGTVNSDSSAWVAGVYANFQVNDKFSLNGRAEHLAVNAGQPSYYPMQNLTADELTLTAQYNLWANVISRVEFRWDHLEHSQSYNTYSYYSSVSGSRGSSSSSSSLGFDNSTVGFAGTDGSSYSSQWIGIHQNAYMLAVNLIYQF